MNKKITIMILSVITALSLTACASKDKNMSNEDNSKPDSTVAETSEKEGEKQGISAEKKLFDVKVTLPATFFQDSTPEEIEASAKEKGIKKVEFNEDGSVVYTMSKSDHKKLLEDTKKSIDDGIKDMLEDEEGYSSYDSIEYNKDCTEFTIYCDGALYNDFDSFGALGFYFYGNYYQAISGVNSEEIKTVVYFKDKDTKEVLDTFDSTQMGE